MKAKKLIEKISMFKRKRRKPTAAVFVDFEHWCYSLYNLHTQHPQIKDFYEQLIEKYDVQRLLFFGDFTQPALRTYIEDIRKVTNNIIDTQNGTERIKKDFTDFIMLDYIYQDVDQYPQTDTYVIFSGDGHFCSVASYLTNKKKKHLVVCGIQQATSNQLKALADECIQFPCEGQELYACQKMIIENLDYLCKLPRITYPTFSSTVRVVSERNNVEEQTVRSALEDLIRQGIVRRKKIKVNFREICILQTDWDAAKSVGLLKYEV